MGAPGSGIEAAERPAAEALLDTFKTIEPTDKARHQAVLDYWLSIRGNRELPPLRDLDPLEIRVVVDWSSGVLDSLGRGKGEGGRGCRVWCQARRRVEGRPPFLLPPSSFPGHRYSHTRISDNN